MAYTTPPTFTDLTTILSAAQLNILSDDVEYLNGLIEVVNPPFTSYTYGSGEMGARKWTVRHRHRYLHYNLTIASGNINPDLRLWYNGVKVREWTSGNELTAPVAITGYIDLQALTLTQNQWYEVYWGGDNSGTTTAYYFFESPTATL